MRHQSQIFNFFVFLFSTVTIISSLLFPGFMTDAVPWFLFVSVVVLGIPHGAIDHIIAGDIYGFKNRLRDHLLFYSSYLLVMLAVGLLWFFAPAAGMIFFLLISVYHFGQSDAVAMLHSSNRWITWFTWVRGTAVIGLIIFATPEVALPIIETAIRRDPGWFDLLYRYSGFISLSIVLIYSVFILFAGFVADLKMKKSQFYIDSVILIFLFYATDPLIAFAVYFALWHSAGHVQEMINFFAKQGRDISIPEFYKLALPFTGVSLVGLLLLFYIYRTFSFENEMISLLFILISVLTLPHMLVVDKMFKSTQS